MVLSRDEFLAKSKQELLDLLKYQQQDSETNEIISWEATIDFAKTVLSKINSNCLIGMEYNMPFSASRIDMFLFYKTESGYEMYILELKQWENKNVIGVEKKSSPVNVVLDTKDPRRLHPAIQLLSYEYTLHHSYKEFLDGSISISLAAVLLNYNLSKDIYLTKGVFEEKSKKIFWFDSSNISNLVSAVNSKIKDCHSTSLLNSVNSFTYIDDNHSIIESIFLHKTFHLKNDEIHISSQAIEDLKNGKHVIITGPAGCGKTAVGLYIARTLINSGLNVAYASANEIKNCFEKETNKIHRCMGMFKLFANCVSYVIPNSLVIFDESHRMQKRQVYQVFRQLKYKKFQTLWLIDNGQSFRKGEDTTLQYVFDLISNYDVSVYQLGDSQFRCGGDPFYTLHCQRMLDNKSSSRNISFVKVCDSVEESMKWYKSIKGNKGIVASDSWKAGNIDIGSVHLKTIKDFGVWSSSDVELEVASGYKAQGSQKDYILFLWGNEFVYRKNKGWILNPENIKDSAWKYDAANYSGLSQQEKNEMLKKFKCLYYILLTRFNKEMLIHCIDKETSKYLKNFFSIFSK